MIKERIDDLVDILGNEYAELENTFVIKNNQQLAKYLDDPQGWFEKQTKDRLKYKGQLIKDAKLQLMKLNAKSERAFLLSYREIAKDQIEITKTEIIAKNIPQEVRERIKAMKEFNAQQVANLANETLNQHTINVQIVNAKSTSETLYNRVKEQMKIGIDKGIKQTYSNGRQVSWSAYMEMNIRTTMQQEVVKDQIEYGSRVGQIFYYCDSFADDAPDHAPYTKKIYYNAQTQIPPEIGKFIQQKNIKSMQEIMDAPVYLTTRPNCRHNFHAIPLSEAMGMSAKEIGEKYGFIRGKYKGSNYEKSQEQRKNERMIRKYKLQKKGNLETLKKMGDPTFKKKVQHDNELIRKWQARNRNLIANNPELLKRKYDRENPYIVNSDLGVHYDYKIVDGKAIRK